MNLHQTFRLDENIIKAATKYDQSENRTTSNVYETAIIEYLKVRRQKIKRWLMFEKAKNRKAKI